MPMMNVAVGDHQRRVGREVGGDLDAIRARTHADAGRAPIRGEQHHRHRENVRQQQRQLLDGAMLAASRAADSSNETL